MIDNRTLNLNLPLPNQNNLMRSEDVPRIRDALTALDLAVADRATLQDITNAIAALTAGAPGALNTLNEIAAAINSDANFAATITAQLSTKLSSVPIASSIVRGGVKIGSGLVVDGDGVLSTTGAGTSSGLLAFSELTMVPSANGQTAFTPAGGYSAGQIELFLNGVLLYGNADDYTASNGTTITLATGINTVDKLLLRKWIHIPIETAVNKTGDTMTGALSVPAGAAGTQVPQTQEVVRRAGDGMSGPLTVPAGATGSQVPQSQEVVKKVGDTMTGPLSVPAGAVGAQVPQAQEVLARAGGTMTGTLAMNDKQITGASLKDVALAYFDSNTTNTLDYTNGQHQRWAPGTGAQTLAIANWPPTGNLGELLIEGVNLGAATITWPTINWIKGDGTQTTTFSANGVTLQSAGTDFVVLWTRNAGATIFGKVVR